MRKIDFFIIGAQKSGTTSVYQYLLNHPHICFSIAKELHFFVEEIFYKKGEDYLRNFFPADCDKYKLRGASYVHMLSNEECPERVFNYNPESKFIVILRDPVERAYSSYHYALQNSWEKSKNSFIKTLELEPERMKGTFTEKHDLAYFNNSMYYKHLRNWTRFFPKENFLLLKFDELQDDPENFIKKILKFLDVEDRISIFNGKKYNKTGKARFHFINRIFRNKEAPYKSFIRIIIPVKLRMWIRNNILKNIFRLNTIQKEYKPLSTTDREKIEKYFEADLFELKNNFNIDLIKK